MIAWHIFAICAFLSILWGIYLAYTIADYREVKANQHLARRGDTVKALRRMVVAVCVFCLPFAFVFRTAMVLAGFGQDQIGQVVFFAIVGPNVVGSIFAVVSLRYD